MLLIFAAGVGVIVGLSRSVEPVAALAALLGGWIGAALIRRTRQYAVALNVILAVVLPDWFGNVHLSQPLLVAIWANVGVLLALYRPGPLHRADVGLVLLVAAVSSSYLIGGPLDTAPGAVGFVVACYATGRSGGVRLKSFAGLLLLAGAVHGAIAVAQSLAPLAPLIPFQPLSNGLPFLSGRASGLFNNPNTLGDLEAVVLVIAIRLLGLRRWMLPLVGLCVAGLVLSSSREAVFGLAAGVSLLGVSRFRQMVGATVVFIIVGIVVFWSFPSLLDRLDPSGFASDPNLLGRIAAWQAALQLIDKSALLGYGAAATNAVSFVDNAYLVWLLTGGVVGLVLWTVAATVMAPRLLWPLLAGMFAIAMFANPFSGPVYAVFLLACGAVAAEEARPPSHMPRDAESGAIAWTTVERVGSRVRVRGGYPVPATLPPSGP